MTPATLSTPREDQEARRRLAAERERITDHPARRDTPPNI